MRLSLSVKLISLLAVIIASALLILLIQIIDREKEIFNDAFEENAKILAIGLDAGIASREQLTDVAKLQADIYKFMWLYPELIGISMSTLSGDELKIVASNYTEEIGILSEKESIDVYENGGFLTETITMDNGERAFNAIAPIHVGGQIFGVYNIKISLKTEEEMIAGQQRNVVAAILISIIILVSILYSLLSLMVIRPIAKIKEGLTKIANGDLSQRFALKSKDEIGDLAERLNGMVEKLEGSYKNLEDLAREREETIQERTKEIQTKLTDLRKFNNLTVGRELKMKELKEEIKELKEEIKRLENEK